MKTEAVRNQAIQSIITTVREEAGAKARAEVLSEIAAKIKQKAQNSDFNPEHFIQDLGLEITDARKAAAESGAAALKALASYATVEMAREAGALGDPRCVVAAIEQGHRIKPSMDDAGNLTIIVEENGGRSGRSLQEHIRRMKTDPTTAYLFDNGDPSQKRKKGANPWLKDSFNLSEQGRVARDNPALAQRLRAEAGLDRPVYNVR